MKQCECGKIIKGTSESHLKYNFVAHVKGFTHKKNVKMAKLLKEQEHKEPKENENQNKDE